METKKLKILIGNNTLAMLAGSETWTLTLATQLSAMGHKVHCFSPELGIISEHLEENGIRCFSELSTSGVKPFTFILEEKVDHEYDVIIANHNHIVEFLRSQYPKTPIMSTIHGVMHTQTIQGKEEKAPEHPSLTAGVNQFIAVSEEVKSLLQEKYNIDSLIIRNFLDTKKFRSRRSAHPGKPKQILFNSNYNVAGDPDVQIVRDVAKHYGAKLAAVGENFVSTSDIVPIIESSDIVIGMGRSVLEGISMGRLGIVHGRWGTGGVVHEGNIEDMRACNFSGRNSGGIVMTAEQMIEEIDRFYNPTTLEWGMNYIRREHNVVHAAEIFIATARELLGQDIIKPADDRRPYRRARNVATA